jgi:CBS domain containing-hemolysin-like protein
VEKLLIGGPSPYDLEVSLAVLLVLGLLILANAFYVAAEFGAVGVRRSRVRRLAEDGNVWARQLLPFVEQPAALDRFVAVSQVGITLSSLVLGAVAQGTVAVWLAPHLVGIAGLDARSAASTAAIAVLIVLTAAQVLFGELMPKTAALRFPTQVALATVLPMRWSLVAFRPFIALLNGSATGLLHLLGMRIGAHRHLHSPDEIALLFTESRDGGLLEPEEQARLARALRLGTRTARDLMVPRDRLTMVNTQATWPEVINLIAAHPFSRLPAWRDRPDQIVGMLRVKDLVHRYLSEGPPASIETLLRPYVRVPTGLSGDRVIALLRDKRAHQAVVVNDAGEVVGIITIQDVLGAFLEPARAAL